MMQSKVKSSPAEVFDMMLYEQTFTPEERKEAVADIMSDPDRVAILPKSSQMAMGITLYPNMEAMQLEYELCKPRCPLE